MGDKIFGIFLAFCLGAGAVRGDDLLQSLENGFAARPWEAVGKLDIGGRGFCTAVLVADDLVLTAAHCLFDRRSGVRIDPATITFRAGWRRGHAAAASGLRRAVAHPDFDPAGRAGVTRVRNDVALLELSHPIRRAGIEPFATGERPVVGDRVGVVSYARHREEAPSLQEECTVLAREGGVLVTSCVVGPGASGSPIFSFAEGQVRIVSLVSAMAEVAGEPVALGTALQEPLADLEAALAAAAPGVSGPASARRVAPESGRRVSGAKFVRPPTP